MLTFSTQLNSKGKSVSRKAFLLHSANILLYKTNVLNRINIRGHLIITVPAPLKAADTIRKLSFAPSDYHIKMT